MGLQLQAAKLTQFDVALRGQKDIVRFDVSVDDPF